MAGTVCLYATLVRLTVRDQVVPSTDWPHRSTVPEFLRTAAYPIFFKQTEIRKRNKTFDKRHLLLPRVR